MKIATICTKIGAIIRDIIRENAVDLQVVYIAVQINCSSFRVIVTSC